MIDWANDYLSGWLTATYVLRDAKSITLSAHISSAVLHFDTNVKQDREWHAGYDDALLTAVPRV